MALTVTYRNAKKGVLQMSKDEQFDRIQKLLNRITPWHDNAFRCRRKMYFADPKIMQPLKLEGVKGKEPFQLYGAKGRKLKYSHYIAQNGEIFVKVSDPPKLIELYFCSVTPGKINDRQSTEKVFLDSLKSVKLWKGNSEFLGN